MSNSFADKLKAAAADKEAEQPLPTEGTEVQAPAATIDPGLLHEQSNQYHDINPEALNAVDDLLANVQLTPAPTTGMENSATVVAAQAFNPGAVRIADGMARNGYYSNTKGRVKGRTAEQIGGRFYFDLEQSDEDFKRELEALVKAGVYEKIDSE